MLVALQRDGFGDLLQQGVWAISALAAPGLKISARDLVTRMDISKQAVSQLVDTLVAEGYVDRRPDTEDRRRTLLELTPRGQAADAGHRRGSERGGVGDGRSDW